MMLGKRGTLIGFALALIAAAAASGKAQTSTPATGGTPLPPAVGDTLRFKPATAGESLLTVPPVGTGEIWTLARCIQTALTQNAQVVAARAGTQRASGSALAAWNGIIPSLTADATYDQSRRTNTTTPFGSPFSALDTLGNPVTGFGIFEKQETGAISASLSSNIISGPAIGEKKRRDHLSGAAQSDEAEVRNSVVYQVKSQYFALLKADRLAVVARDTERLARDEETRAEALFSVGTVARGDVLKARARRATTQADRLRAENQVQIQAARLKRVLGISAGTSLAVEPILDQGVVIPDSAASIRQALTARPRLAATQAAEQAAKSNLFGAKAQRLPVISGFVGVNRNKSDESLKDIYVPGQPNAPAETTTTYYATLWRGEVRASLPLFDAAIEGGIRQAKANLLEAETNSRQRELDVTVEVQEAWLTLREAIQRIGVAREGLVSAEEDYKFSKGRYDLGAGTYLDLLTAEVQLAQARTRLVEAMADTRVAEAGLEFAIGAKRY